MYKLSELAAQAGPGPNTFNPTKPNPTGDLALRHHNTTTNPKDQFVPPRKKKMKKCKQRSVHSLNHLLLLLLLLVLHPNPLTHLRFSMICSGTKTQWRKNQKFVLRTSAELQTQIGMDSIPLFSWPNCFLFHCRTLFFALKSVFGLRICGGKRKCKVLFFYLLFSLNKSFIQTPPLRNRVLEF